MVTYHRKNIRALLVQGFTEQQLRRLCHDLPDFRPVYDSLAETTGKDVIVDRLIEHAERTMQLDGLLTLAREQNPARYTAHQPYYDRAELETELAKIEQGISTQENLRGILPAEQIEAMLTGLLAKRKLLQALLAESDDSGSSPRYQATVTGSGAVAQGDHAQAVGAGGVIIGGNVSGSINTGSQERTIDTGGGAYNEGQIDTGGGTFVGRDQGRRDDKD